MYAVACVVAIVTVLLVPASRAGDRGWVLTGFDVYARYCCCWGVSGRSVGVFTPEVGVVTRRAAGVSWCSPMRTGLAALDLEAV